MNRPNAPPTNTRFLTSTAASRFTGRWGTADRLRQSFQIKARRRSGNGAASHRQAQHINGLVRSLLERDPGAAVIVTGDFNDFGDAPAMQVMTEGDGVVDQCAVAGFEEQRYTFVFSGASQLIDGMLIAPGLLDRIADVAILHTNADFPDAWGSDLSAERIAYKSTDHDIPLLILQWETVAATAEPETTAVASPTPETVTDEVAEENSADNPLLPIAAGAILLGLFALGGFLFWRQRRAMQ